MGKPASGCVHSYGPIRVPVWLRTVGRSPALGRTARAIEGRPITQRLPPISRSLLAILVVLAAIASHGCRDASESTVYAGPACLSPPVDMRQTFDCLREWHARGAYGAMRPYLDPETGEDVIDLLLAMDALLAANHEAQAVIRRICPEADLRRYDISFLQQHLEFFSTDLEYLRQQETDDRAVVTVQVAGRMPLQELHFRRHREQDGPSRWLYVPAGQPGRLVPLVREIKRALNQVSLVLSTAGRATPKQVQNEFEIRVLRRIEKELASLSITRGAPKAE